jgi:uncharacterized protein YdeI (YjbR/CyaY-like superfamily)
MKPTFFSDPSKFRKWLEKNHDKEQELLVGFYKKGSGKPSITWPESVDEALCFGWIDGVRKSIDDESYTIRFTPRKPGSIWSVVNIGKVKELTKKGLMHPAGLAAFEKRKEHKSAVYSFEQKEISLGDYEKQLKANKKAWSFWTAQPPSYRKAASWWVISAKQETTRLKRLSTLIADCEAGQRIAPLRWTKK